METPATPIATLPSRSLESLPATPLQHSIPEASVPSATPQRNADDRGTNTSNVSPNINMSLNVHDFAQLLQNFYKPGSHVNYDKNIIPVFDPSQKNQRIENWLAKVNQCAHIYHWSDEQTAHYALPKLGGNARKWYEGLQNILLTWPEWQEKLTKAFPSESNYGALLTDMLERRMRIGESIDEYYYDKMILLNACDISKKRAVDCLIHGIDDRMIRASASSARFQEPEDLLKFMKDLCRETNSKFRPKMVPATSNDNKSGFRGVSNPSRNINDLVCYNCKEKGHISTKCPKPIRKCNNCNRIGHSTTECRQRGNSNNNNIEKRILFTETTKSDSKYHKTVLINNIISADAFVDFGSDCTLIRKDFAENNSLVINKDNLPNIRGFGNSVYIPVGKTKLTIRIGDVCADVEAYVVENSLLSKTLLIGQNFTERDDLIVIKTNERLEFLKREIQSELTSLPVENNENGKVVLRITSDVSVDTVDLVDCSEETKTTTSVFIEDSVRWTGDKNYCIVGGIYSLQKGLCQVTVCNMSTEPLYLKSDITLARAQIVVDCDSLTNNNNNNLKVNQISGPIQFEPITIEEVNINEKLSQEQKDSVVSLINKHRHCFAKNLSELGCTNVSEMEIVLSDQTPVVYRPYRLSFSEREKVREIVQELIDNNVVEESTSSYASPIILVSKKDGGSRLCVDFRALNRKTVKDHFPMPRIDDQLDLLNGNRYFSSLDLASGYYQIPVRADCRYLTAFITPDGLYQFKKMPFGLVNSPSVFQRTINKVLGNTRFRSALAYMDDILIPGKDFKEEYERLEKTFELIEVAGLTLNLKKCNFFKENLEYLGYEISQSGVKPGKLKIDAVNKFPTPKNPHEVRQFIGLASYFRKFIRNFAAIARPLTDLTQKNFSWQWGAEQEKSFCDLKEALVQRPLLGIYDPRKITFLHTDASKYGLGGILMQKDNEELPLKPVAYFSRKTTHDEQNYHAYELETLAVVASLQRFRVYLLGIKFTLVTDCSALRASFAKRDLIPRIARWWIILQEYNFDIVYKPGHTMSHVDALSRNPQPSEMIQNDTSPLVLSITQEDWLLSIQLDDSELKRVRAILEDKNLSDVIEIKKNYEIKNNRLYRKINDQLKWVVPKSARFQICKLNHDDIGHFSVEKTLAKIKKDFWFPKMRRFITKYVRSCIECAYSKEPSGPKEGLLHPIHKVDRPFDTVHIDHLGPFVKSGKGYSYLLVLVDSFTKFCLIKPLRNLKSRPTISTLEDIFSTFGYPNRLISDRGTSFTSQAFKTFCNDNKIRHILNAVSSPRANGQVERYNRTILDGLTAYTDKLGERNWDKGVGKLQWGLNNTLNKGIGKAPSEVLFGIQLLSKGDNIFANILEDTRSLNDIQKVREETSAHIEKDQQIQKDRYDKNKIKAREYKIGDLVKILKPTPHNDGKSKKLLPKFSGPFKITKVMENDRYEVSSIKGSAITQRDYCNVWAADRIKPWISVSFSDSSDSDKTGSE